MTEATELAADVPGPEVENTDEPLGATVPEPGDTVVPDPLVVSDTPEVPGEAEVLGTDDVAEAEASVEAEGVTIVRPGVVNVGDTEGDVPRGVVNVPDGVDELDTAELLGVCDVDTVVEGAGVGPEITIPVVVGVE